MKQKTIEDYERESGFNEYYERLNDRVYQRKYEPITYLFNEIKLRSETR